MESQNIFSYTYADLKLMPKRDADSNKGTFGRVLCVCGSRGMAGAAFLCAKAVLRTGAGLVELLTPEENRIILQTSLPEAIVTAYDASEPSRELITSAVERADVIVCGCGLGISREALSVLAQILRLTHVPTVIDADALNLLSRNPTLKKYARGAIITPHPGEMSRLIGIPISEITADRINVCRKFAAENELICVLKGHRTTVSDGKSVYINNSGNSGMATAGAGDVLAGIIGGILAQSKNTSLSTLEIASLGVYIHGLCGDMAAVALGEYSVIASDIISNIPKVLKNIK